MLCEPPQLNEMPDGPMPGCHPDGWNPEDRKGLTDLFFSDDPDDQRAAKRICSKCPLRRECLQGAFDREEDDGIFGGFNPVERKLYRRFFSDDDGTIWVGPEVQELPVKLHERKGRGGMDPALLQRLAG